MSDEKKWTFWQPTPFGVDVDDDDDFDDFDDDDDVDDDDDAADVIRRQRPKRLVVDEQETSSKCRSSQTWQPKIYASTSDPTKLSLESNFLLRSAIAVGFMFLKKSVPWKLFELLQLEQEVEVQGAWPPMKLSFKNLKLDWLHKA